MVTRLGLYAGPRALYGSFSGKTEDVLTLEERVQVLEQQLKDLEAIFLSNLTLY